MIIRTINRLLRPTGWVLSKQKSGGKPLLFLPAADERDKVRRILEQFVRQEELSGDEGLAQWSSYLAPARLSFFAELLQLLVERNVQFENRSVADFGSGTGYLLRALHQQAPTAKLTGFDTFSLANRLAKLMCPAANYSEDFDQSSETFGVIFCTEVLEHLKLPAERLQILFDRLEVSGQLILTVPNGRTDTQGAMGARKDGTGYWGHIHFWSPESWQLFLEAALEDSEIESGVMQSGKNYAIITKV